MITSSQYVYEESEKNNIYLDNEQRQVFMEVIEDSLRISQRTHMFNWLQSGFQYLLAHEVMIFGVKTEETDSYNFEYFSSTRYFNDTSFNDAIRREAGVLNQALKCWQKTLSPVLVSHVLEAAEFNNYTVLNMPEELLKASELGSFIVHGFGDINSIASTFVVFARLSKQPNLQINMTHAHILELLMPHLHCGVTRITGNRGNLIFTGKASKKITGRESEVLQWVHMGKTNWEISTILAISPLTVKNHVQNILRKLDVQNRGQAAVKASKLGLVKILR